MSPFLIKFQEQIGISRSMETANELTSFFNDLDIFIRYSRWNLAPYQGGILS